MGIICVPAVSGGVYTEDIPTKFCAYDDIGSIWLFSEVNTGGISALVVLCGVNVGTTCVSVAFNVVKEETND